MRSPNIDKLSTVCVLLVIIFLSLASLRLVATPPSVQATHRYRYTVAPIQNAHEYGKPCPLCSAQGLLDKYAADGWEFVALAPDGQFIFRK